MADEVKDEVKIEEVVPEGGVMSPKAAGEDVKAWLDYKRVKLAKRAAYAYHISTLIQAMMYGDLVLNDDKTLTHKLNFPVNKDKSSDVLFGELCYKPRLTAGEIAVCLSNTNNQNEIANTIAYGAALTGKATAMIERLDSSDLDILAAVGVFFT